jgi:hypothetical protein
MPTVMVTATRLLAAMIAMTATLGVTSAPQRNVIPRA